MVYMCDYLPLIFAKGYGIIYDGPALEKKNNVQRYQLKKIAKLLLFFNILSITIVELFTMSEGVLFMLFHQTLGNNIIIRDLIFYLMHFLFLLNTYGMGIIWRILYYISYLQTTIEISKFPLFEDLNITKNVLLSFRFSSLVINCTPGITIIVSKIFVYIRAIFHVKMLKLIRGYKETDDVFLGLIKEDVLFNMIPFKLLSEELIFYIVLLLVFIIFRKNSKIPKGASEKPRRVLINKP